MVTRVGGIIGVSVVIGCLLIGGILWFALGGGGKKHAATIFQTEEQMKADRNKLRNETEKAADRFGFLNDIETKKAEKVFETKDEKPTVESPKAPPLPPPSAPAVPPVISAPSPVPEKASAPSVEKPVEKPIELAMAKPPSPIPVPPSPQFLIESDFESDTVGELPKLWRAYAQEIVAKGEKSKDPVWAKAASYELPDGGKVGWDILKTDEAKGGKHVLRILASVPDGQVLKHRCGITTALHVEAGKKYLASFYVRAAREHVKASIKFGKAPVIKELGIDLIDEWKEISIPMEPSTTQDVGLSLILVSPGEMWVDDIRVVQKN